MHLSKNMMTANRGMARQSTPSMLNKDDVRYECFFRQGVTWGYREGDAKRSLSKHVKERRMNKVLVFFNFQAAKVVDIDSDKSVVECEYPNGEKVFLNIMCAGIHSITGDHIAIRVAADRMLSSDEIMLAADKLL